MEVGIMIAIQVVGKLNDTEVENLYIFINKENIKVGSIIVIPNGNKKRVYDVTVA